MFAVKQKITKYMLFYSEKFVDSVFKLFAWNHLESKFLFSGWLSLLVIVPQEVCLTQSVEEMLNKWKHISPSCKAT